MATHHISFPARLAYGFGSVAYGAKDSGFNYFLLMFYTTVVGLEPGLVGLAIFIALVFDALSDPLVGYLSDNWHSRWGRRHPFMYVSALPLSLSYFALWNPPALSDTGLFVYLLLFAILIRTCITLYETPSTSLLPELTSDYDERTRLLSYRYLFGWVGGAGLTILMYGALLVATPEYPVATLNRDGYATYGIIASVLMLVAVIVSSLGTHSQIPHLPQPPERRKLTPRVAIQEIFTTLADRSFVALFVATLFGAVATGLSASLHFLMYAYFWEFSQTQIFITTLLVPVSALGGFLMAPFLGKRLGKRQAVVLLGLIAFTASPLLVVLRLLELLPVNGDPALFPMVATVLYIDLALVIALNIIFSSMVADLVEHTALRTGRRSEGVFYAAVTFTRKSTLGVGALVAGMILTVSGFPQGAVPGEVASNTVWQLGAYYAPTLFLCWMAMIVAVRKYAIEREHHEANVVALQESP